jgi:hypothetical protein
MKTVFNPKSHRFCSFLTDLTTIFENSDASIHKARNELKVIECEGELLVLKSFKVPNLLRRCIYTFFRPSKAEKSYQNALLLEGFAPTPVAFVEYYRNGLLSNSYFVSEHFSYDFTIREPLLDEDFEDRNEVLQAFARFTLALHNAGFFHKDYSPGNVLIKKCPTQKYQFKIVDVNRMQVQTLNAEMRARGFEKLWAKDVDLDVIAAEYQEHYDVPEDFIQQVKGFSNKNKRFKNFKKRLKGKPVND